MEQVIHTNNKIIDKIDTPSWLSKNVLIDNGKPLLVYHGSGKLFSLFDVRNAYDGKLCFTQNKEEALIYTHWDNGDDNWRTINDAWEYLMNCGYILNEKLGYPEKMNLLMMIDKKTGNPIDKVFAYNVIYKFYKEQYNHPTLYYCYIRNAERNKYYHNEFNIYDNADVLIVKKESIDYKPLPKKMDGNLNTYIE